MVVSRHNIFSRVQESDQWFIVNPLSRQADILDAAMAEEYSSGVFSEPSQWAEKGYLVESAEEEKRYRNEYLNFLDHRDADEVQLFFVPSYSCNFACTYCYQEGYTSANESANDAVIKEFFNYIDSAFAGRRTYLTIFGGEPLLPGENTKQNLLLLLSGAKERALDTAIVTNGFTLREYVPLLKGFSIREIQVTLDGVGDAHNTRRPHKSGTSSFDRIADGIDDALAAGLPINLRMVVDRENIDQLPILARFAIDRGWTNNPLFKTQLGRNYELHTCQQGPERIFSRIDLYKDVFDLIKKYPYILEFHKPAFSLARFLWENGELPEPLFESCPGTKTEWAFDATGKIYSCTATVGKTGEELGTFYPDVKLNKELVEQWEERDVTSVPECATCAMQLACGGGCASVAKNKTGNILSPDCRPVKELMELGMSLYFENQELDNV